MASNGMPESVADEPLTVAQVAWELQVVPAPAEYVRAPPRRTAGLDMGERCALQTPLLHPNTDRQQLVHRREMFLGDWKLQPS